MLAFVRHLDISYTCFVVDKRFVTQTDAIRVELLRQMSAFILDNRGSFDAYDRLKVYYTVAYQCFIGLQTFRPKCPFQHGVLPEFRKRLGKDFLVKINEMFLKDAKPTPAHAKDKDEMPAANGNAGTMILDATCSPSNIRFPQDFSFLNEAREKKENRAFCEAHGIEISGRKPGRQPADGKERRKAEKKARKNDADRIEVERFFSVGKRCCGAGLVMTKLSETTLGSIALSVLVANLFGVRPPPLFFILLHGRARCGARMPSAGDRGRGGMTGGLALARRRPCVATCAEIRTSRRTDAFMGRH